MSRTARLAASLALLALVAAACGQHPGVHDVRVGLAVADGADGPGTDPEGAAGDGDAWTGADDGAGWVDSDGDGAADAPGGADGAAGSGGSGTDVAGLGPSGEASGGGEGAAPAGSDGSGGQAPGGTAPGQPPPAGQVGRGPSADPNDRRGVSDTEVRIGLHAPLSGAAPLPQTEFQTGQRMYWDAVGPVDGRTVRVIVRDDQYNPSRATSVCNDLIQREQVFVLVGGGGADQIAACSRTAAQQGVPYLSAGVDEGVIGTLPNYFALSMTYPQQATLLAQYIDKHQRPSDGRVALVRDRTPSYNTTIDRITTELRRRGLEPVLVPYTNGPGTAQAVSSYEVAFVMMAPSQFVQILRSPGGSRPFWVGVGIMMGLNTVITTGCQGGNPYRGMHLSPFPGLNVIDDLDPGFRRAGGRGDIELAFWGLNKSLHEILKRMDGDPRRSRLIQIMENAHREPLRTGVYPEVRSSPDNHFGATSAHVLNVSCAAGRHETPRDGLFRSSF